MKAVDAPAFFVSAFLRLGFVITLFEIRVFGFAPPVFIMAPNFLFGGNFFGAGPIVAGGGAVMACRSRSNIFCRSSLIMVSLTMALVCKAPGFVAGSGAPCTAILCNASKPPRDPPLDPSCNPSLDGVPGVGMC